MRRTESIHEENRGGNLEIPLFELEQRFEKLETQFQYLKVDRDEAQVSVIGAKLSRDLHQHLPKVATQLDEMKKFKAITEQYMREQLRKDEDEAVDSMRIQKVITQVQNLKAELEVQTNIFGMSRLKQIDDYQDQIQQLNFQTELLKINIENCAQKNQLDDYFSEFEKYAKKSSVADIQADLGDFVRKSDFELIAGDITAFK